MEREAATASTARTPKSARVTTPLRVLLVEDVATVAAAMQAALRGAGFEVEHVLTGAEAVAGKQSFRPEIALIDLGLPDVDGIELVERFAAEGDCGVIVVTGNDETAARVAGLETGADDYLVKPVQPSELIARIRAVHRRMTKPAAGPAPTRISVDFARRCLVTPQGQQILLTEAEMLALEALLEAGGTAVAREALSRAALKRELHADDRAVDQLVMKLRRKLTEAGTSERIILSARRQGYTIADPGLFRMTTGPGGA